MIPLIYRDMEPLQNHFFQMSNHRDQTCDSSSISLVMLQYYMNTCSKERTAVKKCVVPGERLGTTHFGIYPFYWSLLFELYDYIISTVYVKNYSGHNLALKAGAIKLLEAAGQMAS